MMFLGSKRRRILFQLNDGHGLNEGFKEMPLLPGYISPNDVNTSEHYIAMNQNVCTDYNHKSCCSTKLHIAQTSWDTRLLAFASVSASVYGR